MNKEEWDEKLKKFVIDCEQKTIELHLIRDPCSHDWEISLNEKLEENIFSGSAKCKICQYVIHIASFNVSTFEFKFDTDKDAAFFLGEI